MNAKEYQDLAARTLIENPGEFTHQEIMTIWSGMGLAGEAGEVAECIKKGIFHRHGLDREKLIKELGDVCWYLAAICTVQGIDLGDVMQANIDKLQTRYPDGFSTADSVKRVDVESDFDICECGHSRKDHHADGISETCCYHIGEGGRYDDCTEFTLAATVAHDEPVEMCQCGHGKDCHSNHNGFETCGKVIENEFCQCQKYTPIPALLRGEQPPLFDTDK